MTTQEMIDWLQRPVWERTHRREADAIASRLKALEEKMEFLAGYAEGLLEHPGLPRMVGQAILDTVRGGGVMNDMTTKALINWSLEQAELCRSDYPRPDLADMHEAIAARLKALNSRIKNIEHMAAAALIDEAEEEYISPRSVCNYILDTVREVE